MANDDDESNSLKSKINSNRLTEMCERVGKQKTANKIETNGNS